MKQETSWKEAQLLEALRPFAIIASHIPLGEMEKDDSIAIDDDHPDILLRTQDFQRAYDVVTKLDPAFSRGEKRNPTLLDRTFGNERWGWLAYTLLGLAGGYIAASAHGWAAALSDILKVAIQA